MINTIHSVFTGVKSSNTGGKWHSFPFNRKILPVNEWKAWMRRAKDHMKGRSITQEAVAEKMGVTQGQVGHWLNGRRKINLEEFFLFCSVISADPQEILHGRSSIHRDDLKQLVEDEVMSALSAHPEINSRYLRLSAKLRRLKKPRSKTTSN